MSPSPRRAARRGARPAPRRARPCPPSARCGVPPRRGRSRSAVPGRRPARPRRRRGRSSRGRWRARAASRRPRSAARRRRRAPRAGRPRRRGPPRPGRRPRRWRRRPRGRSAARRRGRRARRRGRARSSMLLSTTSMESRTRSTVCWRLITPARARGAAPKTEAATAVPSVVGPAALAAVPVDEAPDAGLDDQPDPGAVLGAELAEPRHLGLHPGHRGGAQRPGRALQRVGRRADVGARGGVRCHGIEASRHGRSGAKPP